MLKFLRQSRVFLNKKDLKNICIVIGNESCDLDSAASSISLAYLLQHLTKTDLILKTQAKQFLPVLNVPRADYPLKTEVRHLFRKHDIDEADLIFQDELTTDILQNSDFILVDHHVSPHLNRCVSIYDHRPKDVNVEIPLNCELKLELVGSCATLIAEIFLRQLEFKNVENTASTLLALDLLRHTIILDTVNFSKDAGRSTPKDVAIANEIETLLTTSNYGLISREVILDELCEARANISELTTAQLLRKDCKFLTNAKGSIKIAMPGFPQLVQCFIQKPDAREAIENFAREHNCDIVLLMGMLILDDGKVQRDIGLINIKSEEMIRRLNKAFLETREPFLDLEQYNACCFMNGNFYSQRNFKITRKHILPLTKSILNGQKGF